jgi:hypothetical protein
MDLLDLIVWDMNASLKTAIIWDDPTHDYRYLSKKELETEIGESIVVRCPLDLSNKTIDIFVNQTDTIAIFLERLHFIYSDEEIVVAMRGNTFFKGLSETEYPYFFLNVSN